MGTPAHPLWPGFWPRSKQCNFHVFLLFFVRGSSQRRLPETQSGRVALYMMLRVSFTSRTLHTLAHPCCTWHLAPKGRLPRMTMCWLSDTNQCQLPNSGRRKVMHTCSSGERTVGKAKEFADGSGPAEVGTVHAAAVAAQRRPDRGHRGVQGGGRGTGPIQRVSMCLMLRLPSMCTAAFRALVKRVVA
jgi:hypothetical protein